MAFTLKVAEAFQNDIGRGIARLDSKAKSKLGVSTGDIIKLLGRKAALAIVWQAHPDDEGLDMVRIDGILRQNVGIGLGELVKVEKAETKEAKKVVLAPTEAIRYGGGFEQYVKKRLIGKPVLKGNTLPVGIFGTSIPLVITQAFPQGPVVITENTALQIKQEPAKEENHTIPSVTYDDVGGMRDAIQKIREMVELPLRHPEIFERLGIDPPKGVLFHGPPGTGKTLLAKAVANESDANFFYIGGPEIISKFVGESEEKLRKLFKEAQENAPSIIFLDEIDAISPKREEVVGEVEKRLVSQLLTLMDGLKARGEVIVIGATNRPDALDQAIRRPGRFDREIEIGVPDKRGRKEILQIHTRNMPLEKVKLENIANITHGYTGADLSFLTKEAALKALRRILPSINIEEETIPAETLEKLKVNKDDFSNALREIQPSALREVYVERPNVKWSDIGGLPEVKSEIKEAIELPLKKPKLFEKMGIRPMKGVLFYGPPGTGKTLLARAVANESEANFISISGAQVLTKYVGESEKMVRELFKKARMAAPCILFIDEIDAIAPKRRGSGSDGTLVTERVVDTFLTEMDGLQSLKEVIVVAATNRPDILDPALMRAGRFDRVIEIIPPQEEGRYEIFKIHTKDMPLEKKVNLKELARLTEGYTGADIENLVREAGMSAIRDNAKKVAVKHFEKAFKSILPSIKKEDVDSLKKFKSSSAIAMYR